jgi:hypothetical protein
VHSGAGGQIFADHGGFQNQEFALKLRFALARYAAWANTVFFGTVQGVSIRGAPAGVGPGDLDGSVGLNNVEGYGGIEIAVAFGAGVQKLAGEILVICG